MLVAGMLAEGGVKVQRYIPQVIVCKDPTLIFVILEAMNILDEFESMYCFSTEVEYRGTLSVILPLQRDVILTYWGRIIKSVYRNLNNWVVIHMVDDMMIFMDVCVSFNELQCYIAGS